MFGDKVLSFIDGREDKIIKVAGILSAICLVIILALIITGNINASTGRTFLSLNVAPVDAKIVIDGKEYANGVYELPAGEYSAEISKDGFEKKNANIKVNGGTTTVYYDYILNKKEGLDYFKRNATDIAILSRVNNEEVEAFVNTYNQQKAVLDKLPLKKMVNMNAGNARINAADVVVADGTNESSCEMAYCLLVRSDGKNINAIKKAAKEMLSEKGFDLNNYEVVYDLQ